MDHVVVPASVEDAQWLRELWNRYKNLLLSEFSPAWRSYCQSRARYGLEGPERFMVVQPALGFTRYRLNATNNTLTLLGTAVAQQRNGVGRVLNDHVDQQGYKIHAIIVADNLVSIRFREAMGYKFVRNGVDSRSGQAVVIYEKGTENA